MDKQSQTSQKGKLPKNEAKSRRKNKARRLQRKRQRQARAIATKNNNFIASIDLLNIDDTHFQEVDLADSILWLGDSKKDQRFRQQETNKNDTSNLAGLTQPSTTRQQDVSTNIARRNQQASQDRSSTKDGPSKQASKDQSSTKDGPSKPSESHQQEASKDQSPTKDGPSKPTGSQQQEASKDRSSTKHGPSKLSVSQQEASKDQSPTKHGLGKSTQKLKEYVNLQQSMMDKIQYPNMKWFTNEIMVTTPSLCASTTEIDIIEFREIMGPTFEIESICMTNDVTTSEFMITNKRKNEPVNEENVYFKSAVTTSHRINDQTIIADEIPSPRVVAWQKFLTESISKMKRRDFTHPLQSMCIIECTKSASRIKPTNIPDPATVHTLHVFERQPGVQKGERMIMVINYCGSFHFSFETAAIPSLLQSIIQFRNIGERTVLIQTKSNEVAFCSDRFDITYDLSVSPLFDDAMSAFEKRLELIIQEVVDGVSVYLHRHRSTKSKCDRGTSPLFTKGATSQEAQMQKHYRIFNGCTATRPGVNSCGNLVSESTELSLIKCYLMTSILNHHHAQRDKTPFSLSHLRDKSFADEVYYRSRRNSRILMYKEMLGSLYLQPPDEEFVTFVGLFCTAFRITCNDFSSYGSCIEIVADHLAEAHALRWAMDCGGHDDKLTCWHLPLTLAFSFKHYIKNIQSPWLRKTLEETSHPRPKLLVRNLEIIYPSSNDDLAPYQHCMYAAYSRDIFHNHAILTSLRSRLFESSKTCPIVRIAYFFLRETKGTSVDYYHIFENKLSLKEMSVANNKNTEIMQRATLSFGKCYKSPMTLTRMVRMSFGFSCIV